MSHYPKSIRKVLLELKCEAHEREIAEHVEKLWVKFQQWKAGEMGAGELSHHIHEYDSGPARKMFSFYNDLDRDLIVARAIVDGHLSKDEVPPAVLTAIAPIIGSIQRSGRPR